jgi:hypothetical protein
MEYLSVLDRAGFCSPMAMKGFEMKTDAQLKK